jgi:hypothetical protein
MNSFGLERQSKTASQVRKGHPGWSIECIRSTRSTKGGLWEDPDTEKKGGKYLRHERSTQGGLLSVSRLAEAPGVPY